MAAACLRFTTFTLLLLLTISFLLLTIPGAAHAQAPEELTENKQSLRSDDLRKQEVVRPQDEKKLSPLSSELSTSQQLPPTSYQLSTSSQSPHMASIAIYNFSHAMSCILIGQSPIAPCLEYKMVKDATGAVRSVPYLSSVNTSNGVLGMSLSMIGEVISKPPIHSSLFIANLGEQIGIKSAHAQVGGSGSGVLAPIFKLWEVSRNISYLVMIIIFIGVGFMVMFRQKLNPQTVVSVQLALPGLVIGLVMITFSYFLASLISDMAFVGTNLVGYYFSLAQGSTTAPAGISSPTGEQNVLKIFSQYTNFMDKDTINAVYGQIKPFLDNTAIEDFDIKNPSHWANPRIDAKSATEIMSKFILFQILSPLSQALGGIGTTINVIATLGSGDSNIGTALSLIATFVLIYSMFRLLLRLIQNFLSIIFLTISAPFYFLAASIPGKQGLAATWMFNMLCNVLAFPATFGLFYFVAYILGPTNPVNAHFQIQPPAVGLTGPSTFPLLGGLTNDFLNRLLAFGALVASPSIPDIICRAVGKPSQLGALAAGAVGGAMAAGQRYQGQAAGGLSSAIQSPGRLTSTRALQYSRTANDGKGGWIDNPLQTTSGTIRKAAMSIPLIGQPLVARVDKATATAGERIKERLKGRGGGSGSAPPSASRS